MFNFGVAILGAIAVGIAARRFPRSVLPSLLGIALTGAVVMEALPHPINLAPVVEDSDLADVLVATARRRGIANLAKLRPAGHE